MLDESTQKIKILTNHISDQRPCQLGYSKQSHRKTRLLLGQKSAGSIFHESRCIMGYYSIVVCSNSKQSHRKIHQLSAFVTMGYSKQSHRKIHQLSAFVTMGYSKQSLRKIRLLSGCHLLCRLKINQMLPTFQWNRNQLVEHFCARKARWRHCFG